MNTSQLRKLGVPDHCIGSAIQGLQAAIAAGAKGKDVKEHIKQIVERPAEFLNDAYFSAFASELSTEGTIEKLQPIAYRTWGTEIDDGAHHQMRQACS